MKILKKNICYMILFSGFLATQSQAQDQLPYTFNTAGGYGSIGNQLFDFNFGEMVLINTFTAANTLLSQGFLQPYLLNASSVTDVTVINNVITPNGDGKNDLLLITGLQNYPNHKLSIYDRAGRKIYSATDYNNSWNATINGRPLTEDTYYYVIDLGKNWGLIRGFISVVLDHP